MRSRDFKWGSYWLAALAVTIGATASVAAQQGRGAPPAQLPQSGQAGAALDLTGYWVAIVTEDWRWRMVTAPPKDYPGVPLNPEGRKIADAWDVSKDGSCLAFGAAGLMRMPTRLHITWENENVLKIETDQGRQTRRLMFDRSVAPPAERSLQGFSVAEWERPARGGGPGGVGGARAGGPPPADGARAAGPPADGGRPGGEPAVGNRGTAAQTARGGSLKVVTTQLSGGWLRRNGVPYSEGTTLTEYYDRFPGPTGETWLVVTTVVADPKYLTQDFVTSSHFRLEPDAKKWDPTPCKP
jgi:hypothetical protein